MLFVPWLILSLFFFNATATTEIYTLSLHDALPILRIGQAVAVLEAQHRRLGERTIEHLELALALAHMVDRNIARSEEHTSELQSHVNLVCRLLLEKKKNKAKMYKIENIAKTPHTTD